jgi:protein SCO1/2
MSPRNAFPVLLLASLALAVSACGSPAGSGVSGVKDVDGKKVGIVEHLGAVLPDGMVFKDENGKKVDLKASLKRPTVLTLAYLRCPNICNKVLRELAGAVDQVSRIKPGKDYDLLTVSFDPREGPDLAKIGRTNLLADMKTHMSDDTWHFLTGDETNIHKLTEAVGFKYKRDKNGDFIHAGCVIFLTAKGKIVRYLGGLLIHPFDVEMAVNDAYQGRPRSLIQRIQQLCYSYDPEGRSYTLNFVQITMFLTIVLVLIFVAFLFLKRKKPVTSPNKPPSVHEAVGGGPA